MFPTGEKFPCPCCGYRVNRLPPGYHEVCPICGWEDDLSQLRFVDMPGAANHVSLVGGQKNFERYGVAECRNVAHARAPVPGEEREASWRPVNPRRDNIETPQRGIAYADSYPEDTTELYYWRATYWRRVVS